MVYVPRIFKNYQKTIKKPAISSNRAYRWNSVGNPNIYCKKTLKGLYNFTLRPILDCAAGRPASISRTLKGVANFFTGGSLFSAAKKVF